MATSDSTSSSVSFRTTSHDTALCVIPPNDLCGNIDQLRDLYDKAYSIWPPHINLIYPFVAPDSLPRAQEQIKAYLTENLEEESYFISLKDVGLFSHRNNSTVFLKESIEPVDSILTKLRSLSLQAIGQKPSANNFHLTIGQTEDNTLSAREYLLSKARLLPALDFRFGALAILIRDHASESKKPHRMRLWGLVPFSQSNKSTWMPSEFWISNSDERFEPESDQQMESMEPSKDLALVHREIQSGITYQHDPEQDMWVACEAVEPIDPVVSITVASYNVLIDSEYPPARDRDPLLVQTIIADTALADVLVLQEVSDDFLSYLLSDSEVQRLYPFVSHAPPNQADIGPLPSLRNIVLLSRWPFEWKFVPFHRRHKGALVATFEGLASEVSGEHSRIVVAGVHLTCGLTDGSVAAKKIQLDNLTRFLKKHHQAEPWIIAGDFNIPTSSYTVNTALKNKAISAQTVEVLSSIESDFADMGLLDAWAMARINAVDDMNAIGDDPLEGEEGGTFVPGNNILAAATCGTTYSRPQRYDRILLRSQEALQVANFSHFGLPQDINGTQIVASDHYGIRSTLGLTMDTTAQNLDMAHLNRVEHIRAGESLSVSSDMTSVLSAHGMFPTQDEIQNRHDAFDLLKRVVLGMTSETEAMCSDIPLVAVPVGSYALNVWTSASDVDCLCIGSISSKTFFKLTQQRLLKAEPNGVRILRKVEAGTGTMLELSVLDVPMDLQYCPAARIVERWPDVPQLPASDPVFSLSILSLRKLKPYRDLMYMQRTMTSAPAFRLAYRCIKLWALRRGVYAPKFGYLGGVHISIMLTWLCKRIAHDSGFVSAPDLVLSFFQHYANFDWANDMVYDAFFHKSRPRYHRSSKEPMVILGYHAPNSNIAHTSTVPSLKILVEELKDANQRCSDANCTWDTFFGSSTSAGSGVQEFLSIYQSYVKIDIQFWGRTLSKGKALLGWVESRCISLIVDIDRAIPNLNIRIWPARFADGDSNETTDYQGCYLIGLSGFSSGKSVAEQSLQKVFDRFLNHLKTDEKNFDALTSWIDVSLAELKDVKKYRLDDRDWGNYSAELEIDSDDDEPAEELEVAGHRQAQRSIPQRPKPTSKPLSNFKLRPASDVINRLRWDPALDPADYIIGYEDRFLGAKETSLEKWKTEQTDEEFIPQHRILYFKKQGSGDSPSEVVWERATRIDKVFGSGAGAGETGN